MTARTRSPVDRAPPRLKRRVRAAAEAFHMKPTDESLEDLAAAVDACIDLQERCLDRRSE